MPVVLDEWVLLDEQWRTTDGVVKRMFDLMTLEIWNIQKNRECPREFLNRCCWDVENVFKEVHASNRTLADLIADSVPDV